MTNFRPWRPCTLSVLALLLSATARAEDPLHVFLRAGPKTHGPGEHDHPLFLEQWKELLAARGCAVDGALAFPTAEELARADVLVMYAADAGSIHGEERVRLESFLARGGGIVAIHDAVCGDDPQWFKTVVGGAWEHGRSRWHEGEIGLCFADREHPITAGASNFDFEDEIYWDLHLDPSARVLANSFHTPFDVKPQMWAYEKDGYRAFVSIPGHRAMTFELAPYRTLLLRGIAWAGKRDADLLVTPEEVAALRYPPGGPKAPERAAEGMVLHPDFEISLVAAEPLIVNPISIDWDPRGRAWVACTPGYPDKERFSGVPPHDYIAILEDADGDGRMDARTLFHEGLDLVTSLLFHRDGIIVTQAPDILWLRDTDGDERCDRVEKLFTGFGYSDTHAVMSNLRWGLDGWIYGTQGYSGNGSEHVIGADGKDHGKIGNGIFRFRPDGSAIEQVVSYGSNTWGLDFSSSGELFFTMANGSHLRHVIVPDWVLERGRYGDAEAWKDVTDHDRAFPIAKQDRAPYQQIDFVGGFTGAAGCLIYSGGAWPDEYAGDHFVAEPTINLVHHDRLARDGETFLAKKVREAEFLASTDLWFRPVHLRSGPDGAMYVLDFYNQAAVHNDTRGPEHGPTNAAVRPDRDHMHGRIWRVQHREARVVRTAELADLDPQKLVAALASPNGWEHTTAHRLLAEASTAADVVAALAPRDGGSEAEQVHRLWLRYLHGIATESDLVRAFESDRSVLARNAARIAGLTGMGRATSEAAPGTPPLWSLLLRGHADPRVWLETLVAHAQAAPSEIEVALLVDAWPTLDDDWQRSALLASASYAPVAFARDAIDAAIYLGTEPTSDGTERGDLEAQMERFLRDQHATRRGHDPGRDAAAYRTLVAELARRIGREGDAARVSGLLAILAEERGTLALAGLRSLAQTADLAQVAPRTAEVGASFEALLTSPDQDVVLATIPLAAQWDADGSFAPQVERVAERLFADLGNNAQPLELRLQSLECLLLIPRYRAEAAHWGAGFLIPAFSTEVQGRVIGAVGRIDDPAAAEVLLDAYPNLSSEGRAESFERIVERPAHAALLLDRVEAALLSLNDLGPHRIFRLRNHPDVALATRARELFDMLQGAREVETEELVAELLPIVTAPGDAERGAELFVQNCATCHAFEGAGAEVGPDLTGMGAHGPAALLPFVVDPNRAVDDAYVEYVARTVDGRTYGGVLVREGPESVVLRSSAGEVELSRRELETLSSTGRSPMPTGLEALGPEALRDIFAYLCEGSAGFRVLDLDAAASASTERGMYDPVREPRTYEFMRFGVQEVDGIPFELADPIRSASGNNVIVLKGGLAKDWSCKLHMPARVHIQVGFALERVHVLGGVAAWGFPYTRERPVCVRWTWHYADGASEEVLLRDGLHFADWIGPFDVPGSKRVEGLLKPETRGQLRRFSVAPGRDAVVERITLESFDNQTAPTFLALTAQLTEDALPPEELWDATLVTEEEPMLEVVIEKGETPVRIVGGGTSHDFRAHYRGTDAATLGAAGFGPISYTEEPALAARELEKVALVFLSNNQPLPDPATRRAIFGHVAAGRGLLLAHAATWHNWPDWPEYNRELVGGGARSHEDYGVFEVRVTASQHPIGAGLPPMFRVRDELYRFEPDPAGGAIEVIAIGRSLESGAEYPVLWTVARPRGRVACTTLGHDEHTHENPAYRQLLRQTANWLTEGE